MNDQTSCPKDCKSAKTPVSDCECSCDGDNHGIQRTLYETTNGDEILVGPSDGGEVGALVKYMAGRKYRCFGTCGKEIVLGNFFAYEHDGGIEDGEGVKHWVYNRCPNCGYDHSHVMLLSDLEATIVHDRDTEEIKVLRSEDAEEEIQRFVEENTGEQQ